MNFFEKLRLPDPKDKKYWQKKKFIIFPDRKTTKPYMVRVNGGFIPAWDDTDHFLWVCSECKEVAIILQVKRNDYYASKPTLYFYLRCPKCQREGQRKIYLTDRSEDVVGEYIAKEIIPLYFLLKKQGAQNEKM